ncbi:MAG TPA: hypothetical protein VK901_19225 [Nitrospiraceae bacterium]|nr:hypothetical protein [Nitrospiraceae bacterium]
MTTAVGCFAPAILDHGMDSWREGALREALKRRSFHQPNFTEGQWILSEAELFDSALADAAWQGMQEQVFSHTCPCLLTKPGEAIGEGRTGGGGAHPGRLSRLSERADLEDVDGVMI